MEPGKGSVRYSDLADAEFSDCGPHRRIPKRRQLVVNVGQIAENLSESRNDKYIVDPVFSQLINGRVQSFNAFNCRAFHTHTYHSLKS